MNEISYLNPNSCSLVRPKKPEGVGIYLLPYWIKNENPNKEENFLSKEKFLKYHSNKIEEDYNEYLATCANNIKNDVKAFPNLTLSYCLINPNSWDEDLSVLEENNTFVGYYVREEN